MADRQAGVELRLLRPEEAEEYARVQRAVFPDYNTTRLGPSFCSAYYRHYAHHPDAFALGAWREGKLMGHIIAAHQKVEDEIQHALLPRAFVAMVRRPHLIFTSANFRRLRNYSASFMGKKRRPPQSIGDEESWIKMPSMCVLAEARGLGLGRLLMSGAMKEAADRGFHFAWGAVAPTNTPARTLYASLGWVIEEQPLPNGSLPCWVDLRSP